MTAIRKAMFEASEAAITYLASSLPGLRWLAYVRTGHGGNVGLKSRDPSDYQVSILEVSGSSVTTEEIIAAEQLWKDKIQSREMGLNRN